MDVEAARDTKRGHHDSESTGRNWTRKRGGTDRQRDATTLSGVKAGAKEKVRSPDRPGAKGEVVGLSLLLVALAFNVYFLRGEARISAIPLNDQVFHSVASARLAESVSNGEPFLDPWVPNWGLGFPVWRSYQPLPHLVAGLLVSGASPSGQTAAFALLATIVTGLLPLAVYAGARIFGLSAGASGLAALLCLIPSGSGELGRYGLSYGASTWLGSGLYTQQFALLLLPISVGLARRALDTGRLRLASGVALALTFLSHLVFGYVGALACVVLALVGPRKTRALRIARLPWLAGGSILLTAWFTVPLIISHADINHSRWEPAFKWDSFGSRAIFSALLDGSLLDSGRLPLLTVALGLALGGCFLLRRDDRGPRLSALTLVLFVLFLGRDTWGHLLLLLGIPADMHLHRMQAAFELSACLLVAWFVDVSIAELRRLRPPLHILAVLVTGAGLFAALSERAGYLRENDRFGFASLAAHRAEEADLSAVMADVRHLQEIRPGRVSAGLAAGWGREFKVGDVPLYSLLTLEGFDQASFLFHALSRAGDVMIARNEKEAAHDDAFGIRAVVAPADRPVPGHLRPVGRHGRFAVYEASRDGYFGLGDVFSHYTGPKSTWYEPSAAWLGTPLPRAGLFVALGAGRDGLASFGRWQPFPAAPPGLDSPRGEVLTSVAGRGRWRAGVRLARACHVVFKSTFLPDLRITVDGVPVPSIRVAPGFPAVAVPAGDHVVEVDYRPPRLKLLLFAVGLATFALVAFAAKPATSALVDEKLSGVVSRFVDGVSRRLPASAVALAALLLLSCRALLRGFLINGHDATAYPPRLVEFVRAVLDGHLPPVWAPDLGNGFGQPLFGFAAPLVYVAALPFSLLGLTLADSYQLGLFGLVAVGAAATYRLALELSVSRLAAVGAAAFWLFAPYLHTDLLVRAAFAEAAALAVSPVAVLALWRLLASRPSAPALAAASVAIAAVVLGHNAVALLLVPALALLVAVSSIGPPVRTATALGGGCALAFGLSLSGFFWAPALAENDWVKTYLLRTDAFQSWMLHFPTLGQLVYSPWGYGQSVPGPDDGMSLMVGPLLLLAGGFGLWCAVRRGPGPARTLAIAAASASALGLFVASPLSEFVWDRVALLQFFVLPWRALALPTIFLPVLAALALDRLPPRAALAVIAATVIINLPHTEPKGYLRYDEEFYEPGRIAANGINTSTLEEYEPRWVGRRPPHAPAPLAAPGGLELRERNERTARSEYVVRLAQGGAVEAATFWYPGWRVQVDGLPVPTKVVPVRGTISFPVPAGVHRVSLFFQKTPLRRGALLVSVLSAALLGAAVRLRRRAS
jgi:hypothetical protein